MTTQNICAQHIPSEIQTEKGCRTLHPQHESRIVSMTLVSISGNIEVRIYKYFT